MSNVSKRYKLLQHFGQDNGGQNAGILLVMDRLTGKKYVEKQFSKREVADRWALHEIQVYENLRSQFIVRSVSSYLDDRHKYGSVFLEFCDVGSLTKVMEKHSSGGVYVPERFVWHVFICLAKAIRFAHYGNVAISNGGVPWIGVIHRDLKPDNVFLKSGGGFYPDVKLGDFGCAIGMAEQYDSGVAMCTPNFEPPEYPNFIPQSDVHQLGSTILCLCGLQYNPSSVRLSYLNYSQQLRQFIKACIKTHPIDRP
ncbi:kinase-like protein, partial [Lojkania enalia]